jgi:hypothetical protein
MMNHLISEMRRNFELRVAIYGARVIYSYVDSDRKVRSIECPENMGEPMADMATALRSRQRS